MDVEEFTRAITAADDDYIEFGRVPPERRLSERPDLCAFLLLDRLAPDPGRDIVDGAEHDKICLRADVAAVAAAATAEDVLTLARCGVMWDEEQECLSMFA